MFLLLLGCHCFFFYKFSFNCFVFFFTLRSSWIRFKCSCFSNPRYSGYSVYASVRRWENPLQTFLSTFHRQPAWGGLKKQKRKLSSRMSKYFWSRNFSPSLLLMPSKEYSLFLFCQNNNLQLNKKGRRKSSNKWIKLVITLQPDLPSGWELPPKFQALFFDYTETLSAARQRHRTQARGVAENGGEKRRKGRTRI